MPNKVVFKEQIQNVQILSPNGKVDKKLGVPEGLDNDKLLELYRWMTFFRRFDRKALALQRTGRLGTYPSLIGQEAVQAGAGLAMQENDWIVPSFREQGVMMVRGVPGSKVLAYWGGDERGSEFDEGVNVLPICVPVGSQTLHGVGLAMAMQYQKKDAAVLSFIGDGGTSEGDFHEGCNFAGVYNAPLVVLIQNNHWAISVPRHRQSVAPTLAQKAIAYGIPGIQVDGNDVMAVYKVVGDALAKARAGEGPTIVEAVTYRMEDHTTADDATKYRPPEELEEWKPKDPILRLDTYLRAQKVLDDALIEKIDKENEERVNKEVAAREAMPAPDPLETFRHLYEEMPPHLVQQMAEMQETL